MAIGYSQPLCPIALLLLRVCSDGARDNYDAYGAIDDGNDNESAGDDVQGERISEAEVDAFWLLNALVARTLPLYFTRSMLGSQVDLAVLKQLLETHLPALHAHMEAVGVPLELVASQWLLCCFARDFPSKTAERVFDWLFLDQGPSFFLPRGGSKITKSLSGGRGGSGGSASFTNHNSDPLLYVLLAFFRSASEELLTATAPELDECVDCIRSHATTWFDADRSVSLLGEISGEVVGGW